MHGSDSGCRPHTNLMPYGEPCGAGRAMELWSVASGSRHWKREEKMPLIRKNGDIARLMLAGLYCLLRWTTSFELQLRILGFQFSFKIFRVCLSCHFPQLNLPTQTSIMRFSKKNTNLFLLHILHGYKADPVYIDSMFSPF